MNKRMNKRFALAFCLATACSLAVTHNAHARHGLGYGGYGAYGIGELYHVLSQNVPHYAAFPPVYYSAPIPRTYGHSPFAYPPGTRTPEIVAAAPLEITNPHIRASVTAPAEDNDKTTQLENRQIPLTILNPYVTSHGAETSLTSLPRSPLE